MCNLATSGPVNTWATPLVEGADLSLMHSHHRLARAINSNQTHHDETPPAPTATAVLLLVPISVTIARFFRSPLQSFVQKQKRAHREEPCHKNGGTRNTGEQAQRNKTWNK